MNCFECPDGQYEKVLIDYDLVEGSLIIPDVPVDKCNKCGDIILDKRACEIIEPYSCIYHLQKMHEAARKTPEEERKWQKFKRMWAQYLVKSIDVEQPRMRTNI